MNSTFINFVVGQTVLTLGLMLFGSNITALTQSPQHITTIDIALARLCLGAVLIGCGVTCYAWGIIYAIAAIENFNKWDQYYQKKERENLKTKVAKVSYEYLS